MLEHLLRLTVSTAQLTAWCGACILSLKETVIKWSNVLSAWSRSTAFHSFIPCSTRRNTVQSIQCQSFSTSSLGFQYRMLFLQPRVTRKAARTGNMFCDATKPHLVGSRVRELFVLSDISQKMEVGSSTVSIHSTPLILEFPRVLKHWGRCCVLYRKLQVTSDEDQPMQHFTIFCTIPCRHLVNPPPPH